MIPLTKPKFTESDFRIIKQILDSGWVAGQGPMNKILAKKFAEFVGVASAVPVNNCTAALHLSLLALEIGKGDDVLVSDFTFPATGHAVLYTHANPIFVDVDLNTYNISLEDLEKKLTDKTKAIIPVHAFGNPISLSNLMKFAKIHDLKVIEDAACAVGAKYRNKAVGSFGDIGCFSFHARKILATGEGGIAISDQTNLIEKISMLSCFGMTSAKEREECNELIIPSFTKLGYNYKLSDILAGLAVSQLEKVTSSVEKRNNIVKIYRDLLEDSKKLHFQTVEEGTIHSYQSCVIRLESSKIRSVLFNELGKRNVQTQFGTYSSVCQPIYQKDPKICPNSVKLFKQTLAIPLYDDLSEEEAKHISKCIKDILQDF